MKDRLVGWLLRLYERAVKAGLLDRPWARRVFEAVYLAYKRLLEAGPTSKLRDLIEPGTSVIDVGANIGFFSVTFGRCVGPGGHVIAIEPESRNFASLRRRIERAKLGQVVECVQAAAAGESGELRLALNPNHPGDHRLAAAGEPVRAVTLDELTEGSPHTVSLVKVDVQGAEMMVLTGARRVLASDRPALFLEVDDEALRGFGSSAEELVARVVGLGYSVHTLTRRGVSPAISVEELVAKSLAGSYSDVLFLPASS